MIDAGARKAVTVDHTETRTTVNHRNRIMNCCFWMVAVAAKNLQSVGVPGPSTQVMVESS